MKNKAIVKNYRDEKKSHLLAVVNYKDNNNQRKRKFFTAVKEAQEFANTLNFQTEKYGKQARNINEVDTQDLILAKRDLKPYNISVKEVIREYIDFTEELKEYNADIRKAVKHFIKWNDRKKQSTTLVNAVKEYLESLAYTEKSQRHITTSQSHLKRFIEYFKETYIVSMIDPLKIEAWLRDLTIITPARGNSQTTKKAVSAQTKNNYRATLSGFFSFCYRRNYIKENPIDKVDIIKTKKEEPRIYTVEDLSYMLTCTDELSEIRLFIALGAFAGLRVAELKKLTWDNIHFKEKEIIVDGKTTKTRKRRVVEISDNLLEWLAPYAGRKIKGKDLIIKNENIFRKALEKFRKAHNITWIDNGLRHSCASYFLAKTQNAHLTAERMGHSVAMLETHYKGLVRKSDIKPYWNIYPKDKGQIIEASELLKENIA